MKGNTMINKLILTLLLLLALLLPVPAGAASSSKFTFEIEGATTHVVPLDPNKYELIHRDLAGWMCYSNPMQYNDTLHSQYVVCKKGEDYITIGASCLNDRPNVCTTNMIALSGFVLKAYATK